MGRALELAARGMALAIHDLCAIPNEAGKLIREDEKPLPFRHGEMSRTIHLQNVQGIRYVLSQAMTARNRQKYLSCGYSEHRKQKV